MAAVGGGGGGGVQCGWWWWYAPHPPSLVLPSRPSLVLPLHLVLLVAVVCGALRLALAADALCLTVVQRGHGHLRLHNLARWGDVAEAAQLAARALAALEVAARARVHEMGVAAVLGPVAAAALVVLADNVGVGRVRVLVREAARLAARAAALEEVAAQLLHVQELAFRPGAQALLEISAKGDAAVLARAGFCRIGSHHAAYSRPACVGAVGGSHLGRVGSIRIAQLLRAKPSCCVGGVQRRVRR
mmetsp:Transcript_5490/g.13864  ORF Transcript_5490/g.13864 Transcript_5490/m.13864 type:complete len:245 (-) Transcript_5490:187-921(-)